MFKKNRYQKLRDADTLKDHLANERTFLAWIRTSVAVMAFGFVVEKFSIFIREMSSYLSKSVVTGQHKMPLLQGYSSVFGIVLIALGALLSVLAFFKYKTIENQIEHKYFRLTLVLDIMLAMSVCLIGIFLVMALTL